MRDYVITVNSTVDVPKLWLEERHVGYEISRLYPRGIIQRIPTPFLTETAFFLC